MTHEEQFETLLRIARRARLDSHLLIECFERRLLPTEGERWREVAYLVACRVRRLSRLGVNMQGVEVVLNMRRRIVEMQREMASLRMELRRTRLERDRELSRLMRELSEDQ